MRPYSKVVALRGGLLGGSRGRRRGVPAAGKPAEPRRAARPPGRRHGLPDRGDGRRPGRQSTKSRRRAQRSGRPEASKRGRQRRLTRRGARHEHGNQDDEQGPDPGGDRRHDRPRALRAGQGIRGALRRDRGCPGGRGCGTGRGRRRRRAGGRRRADRVRGSADRGRPEQDPGHQGGPRADRSGSQGGQGPGRRGAEGGQGGGRQGGGRAVKEKLAEAGASVEVR